MDFRELHRRTDAILRMLQSHDAGPTSANVLTILKGDERDVKVFNELVRSDELHVAQDNGKGWHISATVRLTFDPRSGALTALVHRGRFVAIANPADPAAWIRSVEDNAGRLRTRFTITGQRTCQVDDGTGETVGFSLASRPGPIPPPGRARIRNIGNPDSDDDH